MGADTPTPSPAPSGSGETVRYPDLLREFGQQCETEWGQAAQTEITRVLDSPTDTQHFGQVPAAQQFASVYRAAQHVYVATLQGLKTDLEAAGAAIRAAAESMAARDEASADAFTTLQAQWGAGGAGMTNTTTHAQAEDDAPVQQGLRAQENLQGDPNPSAPDVTPGQGEPGASGPGPDGPGATGTPTTPQGPATSGGPAPGAPVPQ